MGIRDSDRIGKLSDGQRQQVRVLVESYFQNSSVGMTKEAYFDMMEQLGSEPLDEEIPVEYDDLPLEVQEAVQIYNNMQDVWDYVGGNYIGKQMVGFKDILEMYDVPKEDHKTMYELVLHIDRVRAKSIQDAKPKK